MPKTTDNRQGEINLINIYDGVPNPPQQNIPSFKWLNIVGVGKSRKTLTLLELMESARVVYHDLERGTAPYPVSVLHSGSWEEFQANSKWVFDNKETLRPEIVVIDPLDVLAEMCSKHLLSKYNQSDLKSITILGVGNGWNLLYNSMRSVIQAYFKIAPILITITHLKLSVITKNDTSQCTHLDYNLIGQLKNFVNDQADANILFKKEVEGKREFIRIVTGDPDDSTITQFGSRGGVLSELFTIDTPEQFKQFILKTVTSLRGGSNGNTP